MAESAYTQVRRFLFRHPLLTVFGAALLFRLCFGLTFLSSPFRYFHTVPGLDMETLLRLGEWGAPGNSFFFTIHRLQTFILWKLNGGIHPVLFHAALQALAGAAGAALLTLTMRRLTGNRLLALAAGLLWAFNPVELMYEFTTLQDTLVNFGIILSFHFFLTARKRHFLFVPAFIAGVFAGLAATGRPVAAGMVFVLFFWSVYYLHRRRLPFRRAAAFPAGVLALWLCFAGINLVFGGRFACFFTPVPYTVAYNTAARAVPGKKAPALPPLVRTVLRMCSRLPLLWVAEESPENLNIYFLRTKLPLLKLPFEILILLAGASTLLILPSGKWRKKEGLILIPILSLAFFLCVREPIGRYRLLLLPWFALLGVWGVGWACTGKRRALAFLLTLAVFGFLFSATLTARVGRAADFTAWGWALEGEAGRTTPESLKYFRTAWQFKPEPGSAVNVITRAIRLDDRALAERTAAEWMEKMPSPLAFYYGAVAAYPKYGEMAKCLRQVVPEQLPELQRFRYYLLDGETRRNTGDLAGAKRSYASALKIPAGTPAQRRHAEECLKQLQQGDKK